MNEIEKAIWEFVERSHMSGAELQSALNDYAGARFTDEYDRDFAQHLVDEGIAEPSDFPFLDDHDDDMEGV